MPHILDPRFRYTPAAATDIRKTFARVRRELAAAAREAHTAKSEAAAKVKPLRKEAAK